MNKDAKFEILKVAITSLGKNNKQFNDFCDKIPIEISSSFFDNPMIDSLYSSVDLLLKGLCDAIEEPYLHEDIKWFLYDHRPGLTITVGDVVYTINNDEDYLNYLKNEYFK